MIQNASHDAIKQGHGVYTFKIDESARLDVTNRLILELTSPGRHTALYVPVTLLG